MKYTLDEWRAKGKELFGEDIMNWKFVCPACNKISSGADFKEACSEIEYEHNMYYHCIGRHNGKGVNGAEHTGEQPPEFGCNWTAGGLLATLGKGDVVVTPKGYEVNVFAFAEGEE